MKSLLLAALLVSPLASHASQLGCEQTVRLEVSEVLSKKGTSEVVGDITLVPTQFSELAVYSVNASASYPPGVVGIPYATTYLVVVRNGALASCTVESIVEDMHAE